MIRIASHRRSGTHLLMDTLTQNYTQTISENNGNKTHQDYEQLKKRLKRLDQTIYVIRDPRDCLLSCWTWWNNSNESLLSNIKQEVKNRKFKEYVKGLITIKNFEPLLVKQWEHDKGIINDPIKFWERHAKTYTDAEKEEGGIMIVRYEDLRKPEKIKQIGEWLSLKQRNKKITPITKPVGYFISNHPEHEKEIIEGKNTDKWKTVFDQELKNVFKQKIVHKKLWRSHGYVL